ncbi:N-acetylmuramoyl-L-alanine amidase [Alkalihalobacillus macyae]|uniref:peptidoglycan recognition protein family protein n=1 Tax=Guptibacillus hwajinpoensis TaxID=208199 RepID=UPI00273BA795|nr:N-acetylmuramoyl-L-alanine amidase [Alkalihalobacillus macyae]MDP4549862.1 N-acetylmuramoyl-L-alanine amidase [Alkalihalobacillus macyae]
MSRFKVVTADQVIEMLKGYKYKYAQVHHTWKPDHSDFNGSNHIALQESMYRYHANVRGWDDIGQHLTLMPDGKFVTGRRFNSNPAGIYGYNSGAFMIEHVGNFDKGHDKLQGSQLESSLKVYQYLVKHCGASIMFHTEHAAKSCPGTGLNKHDYVYQVLNFKPSASTPEVVLHPTQQKVKDKVISFVLGVGDEGFQVKQLQSDLKSLGYDIGRNGADGMFGRDTKDAVRAFQKDKGLVVDGLAGPNTFDAIKKAKEQKMHKPSGSAVVPYPGNLIKVGSRGKDVKRIQRAVGANPDGIFGRNTEKAVRAYQSRHGLSVDGVVGINTWNKMF